MTKALQKAFDKFHAKHPHVYTAFDQVCQELISRGYDRYSAIMVIGIVVWRHGETQTGEPFKVSTGLAAYYAREWRKNNPEHSDFFKLGTLKDT